MATLLYGVCQKYLNCFLYSVISSCPLGSRNTFCQAFRYKSAPFNTNVITFRDQIRFNRVGYSPVILTMVSWVRTYWAFICISRKSLLICLFVRMWKNLTMIYGQLKIDFMVIFCTNVCIVFSRRFRAPTDSPIIFRLFFQCIQSVCIYESDKKRVLNKYYVAYLWPG